MLFIKQILSAYKTAGRICLINYKQGMKKPQKSFDFIKI